MTPEQIAGKYSPNQKKAFQEKVKKRKEKKTIIINLNNRNEVECDENVKNRTDGKSLAILFFYQTIIKCNKFEQISSSTIRISNIFSTSGCLLQIVFILISKHF